jgi:Spy/CpxP family protein refolding chaperone
MNNSLLASDQPVGKIVPQRNRVISAGLAAVVAGLLTMAGASQAQEGQPAPAPHARHFDHDRMDPAHAEKRLARKIDRLVPDATADQKAKLSAIAKAAFIDLRPLQEKSRAARAEGLKLLSQPTIDRAALERVRQTQQQLADQRSRRMSQAFADAAEVLTPAQRVKVAERLAKHKHGKFGHDRHHDGKSQDAPLMK